MAAPAAAEDAPVLEPILGRLSDAENLLLWYFGVEDRSERSRVDALPLV